jgi:hypothetical protein
MAVEVTRRTLTMLRIVMDRLQWLSVLCHVQCCTSVMQAGQQLVASRTWCHRKYDVLLVIWAH